MRPTGLIGLCCEQMRPDVSAAASRSLSLCYGGTWCVWPQSENVLFDVCWFIWMRPLLQTLYTTTAQLWSAKCSPGFSANLLQQCGTRWECGPPVYNYPQDFRGVGGGIRFAIYKSHHMIKFITTGAADFKPNQIWWPYKTPDSLEPGR